MNLSDKLFNLRMDSKSEDDIRNDIKKHWKIAIVLFQTLSLHWKTLI